MPVDQPELRRRHPELGLGGADAQVAADGQLQAATEAVPVDRGEHRVGMGGDRLHRGVEGVGDERLGVLLEALVRDPADVVAGGEGLALAGDHDAAHVDPVVEPGKHLRDGVENRMAERVALVGPVQGQARDRVGGEVEPEVSSGQILGLHRGHGRGGYGRRPG